MMHIRNMLGLIALVSLHTIYPAPHLRKEEQQAKYIACARAHREDKTIATLPTVNTSGTINVKALAALTVLALLVPTTNAWCRQTKDFHIKCDDDASYDFGHAAPSNFPLNPSNSYLNPSSGIGASSQPSFSSYSSNYQPSYQPSQQSHLPEHAYTASGHLPHVGGTLGGVNIDETLRTGQLKTCPGNGCPNPTRI